MRASQAASSTAAPAIAAGRSSGSSTRVADEVRPRIDVQARVALVGLEIGREQHERPAQERPLVDRGRVVGDEDVRGREGLVHLERPVDDDVEARRRDAARVEVRVALEGEDVRRREGGPKRDRVEGRRSPLGAAAAPERRRVQDDAALAQPRVARQHPLARRGDGRRVEEEVRPGHAQRQDPLDRRAQGRGVRLAGRLAGADDVVVVAVQEGALGPVEPGRRVRPEPLQRADGVPDLDHGRPGPVGRDVDRQVRVVDDEQAATSAAGTCPARAGAR